jgi:alanine racemase
VSPGSAAPAPAGRPTRARIDLGAFAHNLRLAGELAGPGRQVCAVLKADGYGHGAAALAREAARAGAACVGVATAGEARDLRGAGVELPLLVLSEVPPSQAAEVVRLGCEQVLYTTSLAEALEREASRAGRRVRVHVKVDTGMGRVGLAPGEALPFVARLRESPHLILAGLMSHLADADRPESPRTAAQLEGFRAVCDAVDAVAPAPPRRHIANSALLLRGGAGGDLVRPGLMLYGASPSPALPHARELRPVMTLVTAIAFLKSVPAGTPLSYGGTHTTARSSRIATLPVGYADGYRRCLSNRAEVLVRGVRAPVVGTVCMDLCLVDVTDVPGAAAGDEVVLVGRQGGEEITATELAERCGTIAYEIFCGIGPRVPRVPFGGALAP